MGEEDDLVLEEFIQGDTLDFLLREILFTGAEIRRIVKQLRGGLWVLHSLGAVHQDVRSENVTLQGSDAILTYFDAAHLHTGMVSKHPAQDLR